MPRCISCSFNTKITQNKTGVTVHAVAGYSGDPKTFTAEITNIPVTKLYIKKVIDNYQSELENDEIIPEEYTWVRNEVTKGSATVSGKTVDLELGDEVTVAVHNKYGWQPYFHDFDTKTNKFDHTKKSN